MSRIITIDASRANKKHKTGTDWYSFHLIKALSHIDSINQYILYTPEPLRTDLKKDLPSNFQEKILFWPFKYFWSKLRFSLEVWRQPSDILFIPAHTLPLACHKKTKIVTTLHDVAFETFPQCYSKLELWHHRWAVKQAKKQASKILTVSENSKKEIINFFNISSEKLVITPLGISPDYLSHEFDSGREKTFLKKLSLEKQNYFFYLGRKEKKKNTLQLIQAFIAFKKQTDNQYKLVLTGPWGDQEKEILSLLKSHPLKGEIILTPWLENQKVQIIFKNAKAFVFPSLHEGFGLPLLESFALEVPVICSNIPVFHEVAGEGALYFDVQDRNSMINAFTKITDDSKISQNLIEKGKIRLQNFSWEKCAQKTLQTFNSL